MSYLSDITNPLVKVLRHFATLPAHQLAGHAANLDFWRSEVEQRREIIRSYAVRFERMRDAEQAYGREHGFGATQVEEWGEPVVVPVASAPRSRPSTRDSERQHLLRDLDTALAAFLERIEKEHLAPNDLAEPRPAANGAPATRPGDSRATQTPPSVTSSTRWEISNIYVHDAQLHRVVEDIEASTVAMDVELPVPERGEEFEPRVLVFNDAYNYQVFEQPWHGLVTILDLCVVGEKDGRHHVRIETNAGYRELFCAGLRVRGH